MRDNRQANELRPITIDTTFNAYAEGSALISFGNTRVLCTASVEEKQPPFLRGTDKGWVTAEYGMLPRATHTRGNREAARGKQTGRTVEIQCLIGRSLRAVVDLEALGPRSISLDCDVLQADGGTSTAAVSCGFVAGKGLLDLQYSEDSQAEMDANFVMTPDGGLVEVQATAEDKPLHWDQFMILKKLADKGITDLAKLQLEAVKGE